MAILRFPTETPLNIFSLQKSTAIRKDAGLYCGPRLLKGEVFAYGGLPENLKDLQKERHLKGFEKFLLGCALDFLAEPLGQALLKGRKIT